MDKRKFPQIEKEQIQLVVRGYDFKKEFDKDNLIFKSTGIYWRKGAVEVKVYVFIATPKLSSYGLPKFHTSECQTISNFMNAGIFNTRYSISNTATNDLHDLDTGELVSNKTLQLCKYCKNNERSSINTTLDFYRKFSTQKIVERKKPEKVNFVYRNGRIASNYK